MPQDILVDENFDLLFRNGDLVIGESTYQHQQILLLANKGEIRDFPQRGVGVAGWLLDDQSGNLNGEIKREFQADGMDVQSVNTRSGRINVKAEYNE